MVITITAMVIITITAMIIVTRMDTITDTVIIMLP